MRKAKQHLRRSSALWLAGGLSTLLQVGACSQVISVPPDAPVMLSSDTVTSSPYVRQHGQWVKTTGKVTLHAGEVVVVLPATQP